MLLAIILKKKVKPSPEYHWRISCLQLSIHMKRPWLGSKAIEEDGKCILSLLSLSPSLCVWSFGYQ